ncbi:MAG: endonuclease Q family protein [Candidatus Odinarchaeia archaeon]
MEQYIADLHIHSRYSGGCSKNLTIENISYFANLKGVSLIATGDFTFSKWLMEIKEKLEFDEETGLYLYEKDNIKIHYILQSEVNLTIDEGKKGIKRIHNIILAPEPQVVNQINEALSKYGSLQGDARPNLKIQPNEFIEILKEIDHRIEIIPSHIFTPWFGLFGSFSGYDSIKDCYKDKVSEIHALETGLSADPLYIYAISELDNYSIISCSDLHSYYPHRLGREATVFELDELTYENIIGALRTNDNRLKMTFEFKPEEGKYNYDGCRGEKHLF